MAPPSIRRSSSSRKARLSAFTGYVIAGLAALLGAALLIVSLFQPAAFSGLRGAARDVAAPAGEPGAIARSGGQDLFAWIGGYFQAGSQNDRLRRELDAARIKLVEMQAVEAENRRLKALLDFEAEEEQAPVATTRMVGATASSIRRFAFVDAGSSDGIAAGMPVASASGLVGRILETGRHSARVLLLNDMESLVPVRRLEDDVVAFAEGRADGGLRIRLVNLGINPLKPGDLFVTSGAGGLFRPGIPVAVADEITADGALGHMLSNPAATDFVAIMPVWNPALHDAATAGALPEAAAEEADGVSAEAGEE